MPELPSTPEWIPVWHGLPKTYLVRFLDAGGRKHDWTVQWNNFDGTGRRRNMAYYAWPDIPDPDRWDKPVLLHRSIGGAKDEFLVRIVHGWQPGYGFAEGEGFRPIYGKGLWRRERRFIVAGLTGRGVCPQCPKMVHVRVDGTLNAHNRPRSLERCAGTHERPEKEFVTVASMAKAAGWT